VIPDARVNESIDDNGDRVKQPTSLSDDEEEEDEDDDNENDLDEPPKNIFKSNNC
jgi:hypothetical protein